MQSPDLHTPGNAVAQSNSQDLFQAWRVADRRAHALETALTRSSLAALEGKGQFPSDELSDLAHQFREAANDLFAAAMKEMAQRAKSNRHD